MLNSCENIRLFYAFTNAELHVLHTINTVLVNVLPRELQLSNTKHKLERFAPTRTNSAFYTLKVSKSILNDAPVIDDKILRKPCERLCSFQKTEEKTRGAKNVNKKTKARDQT